ncbi:hypothetical protein HK096_009682, partial [Nowakowskiella sp. JEL0078]
EKARRFYERASEIYSQAVSISPDFDSLYNWGRLLLLLAEFSEPPYSRIQKSQLADLAIEKLRAAISIDSSNADALFNLAQALFVRSEIEFERATGPGSPDVLPENVCRTLIAALEEALQVLDETFRLQDLELIEQQKAVQVDGPNEDDVMNDDDGDQYEEDVLATTPVTLESLQDTVALWIQVSMQLAIITPDLDKSLIRSTQIFDLATTRLTDFMTSRKIESIELALLAAELLTTRAETIAAFLDTFPMPSPPPASPTIIFESAISALASLTPTYQVLCDYGDTLTALAAYLRATDTVRAKAVYTDVVAIYTRAGESQPSAPPSLLAKLGDTELARLGTYDEVSTRKVLATNAATWYQRSHSAFKAAGKESSKFSDGEVVDDETLVKLRCAMALSWIEDKRGVCQDVLIEAVGSWKSRGFTIGPVRVVVDGVKDDEVCGIGFAEEVRRETWFVKLLK